VRYSTVSTYRKIRHGQLLATGALVALTCISCGVQPVQQPTVQQIPLDRVLVIPDSKEITDPAILQAAAMPNPGGLAVISSDPAQGASNVFAGSSFQIGFNARVKRGSVERAVSLFAGKYDPSGNPSTFAKLNLTSMCDGQWRVRNSNAFPISFQWDVYKKREQGVGAVPANGEAFFETSRGEKTVRLFVGNVQQSVKASNKIQCSSPLFYFNWAEDRRSVTITPASRLTEGTNTFVLGTGIQGKPQGENDSDEREEDDEKEGTSHLGTPFILNFTSLPFAVGDAFDENETYQLFSAQKEGPHLAAPDFQLWSKNKATGQVRRVFISDEFGSNPTVFKAVLIGNTSSAVVAVGVNTGKINQNDDLFLSISKMGASVALQQPVS
jgi:hypothetical protein